jgi:hypothetical protein
MVITTGSIFSKIPLIHLFQPQLGAPSTYFYRHMAVHKLVLPYRIQLVRSFVLFVLSALGCSHLLAQDNYEIQVYSSPTNCNCYANPPSVKDGYDPDIWTLEIRPIIDKQLGPIYLALNPGDRPQL